MTPFLRRLRAIAPRKSVDPDKPRNTRERLAQVRAARIRPASFYDSRMGDAHRILAHRLAMLAPAIRDNPDIAAREDRAARIAAASLARRAWHSRRGLRLTRAARTWARRRNAWQSGPGYISRDVRPAFPRCTAYYFRTMRADAAEMRRR